MPSVSGRAFQVTAAGGPFELVQREFPELEAEDIREALAYAAANLDDKVIDLATAG